MPNDPAGTHPVPSTRRSAKRVLRFLLKELALFPVTVAFYAFLGWAVMNGVVAAKEYSVRRLASKLAPDMDRATVERRFPNRDANAAALLLERASADVGIDLAPRDAEHRERPDGGAAGDWYEVRGPGSEWLFATIRRKVRVIERPPDELVVFLTAYDAAIERVREVLIDGGLPGWELAVDDPRGPLRNLIGALDLSKLLAMDALLRLRRGDPATADADMEAIWRLNLAGEHRPEPIDCMISLTVTEIQIGVLRQFDPLPREWIPRLADLDYEERLAHTVDYSVWSYLRDRRGDPEADAEPMGWRGFTSSLFVFFDRYESADEHLGQLQPFVDRPPTETLCAARDAPGEGDRGADAGAEEEPYRFVRESRIRLVGYRLALELAEKIQQVEEAWAATGELGPDLVARIAACDVCPNLRWDLERRDSTATIALHVPPHWSNEPLHKERDLPVTFSLELGDRPRSRESTGPYP